MNIQSTLEKLTRNTNFTDSCWLWSGSTSKDGYGKTHISKERIATHRISYRLFRGCIPTGLKVLHTCDTPACWNPDHLFTGTHADNMLDMKLKGRSTSGEKNPSAKLTRQQVEHIRLLYEQKQHTQRELAMMFNVSKSSIEKIIYRKVWI